MERGNKLSTGYRVLSNLNAVPDGDPNGVFSIYLFRSAILTARKLFRTDKAALQGKRYITTPSAAAAAPPLKGRGRKQRKTAQTLSIRPLSHGVLILNRRASSPCTGEPRAARSWSGANPARESRDSPAVGGVRVLHRETEKRSARPRRTIG